MHVVCQAMQMSQIHSSYPFSSRSKAVLQSIVEHTGSVMATTPAMPPSTDNDGLQVYIDLVLRGKLPQPGPPRVPVRSSKWRMYKRSSNKVRNCHGTVRNYGCPTWRNHAAPRSSSWYPCFSRSWHMPSRPPVLHSSMFISTATDCTRRNGSTIATVRWHLQQFDETFHRIPLANMCFLSARHHVHAFNDTRTSNGPPA